MQPESHHLSNHEVAARAIAKRDEMMDRFAKDTRNASDGKGFTQTNKGT